MSVSTARPPLSPRELVAFENLLRDDRDAALAMCRARLNESPRFAEARERGLAALAAARAADAASNNGAGNFYSQQYAEWEALCASAQVAA